MFIRSLISLFRVLKSNDSPKQLAWGVALGTMLGLIPVNSLFNVFVLVALYFFNVNMGLALLTAIVYKMLGVILSGFFHIIGLYLLTDVNFLYPFWTALYNLPIVTWTRFYNTVVLGSFLVSLLLLIPHYFLAKKLLVFYQNNVRNMLVAQIKKYKITEILQGSNIFKLVLKVLNWKNKLKG
ncbi:MAG: TIGR03546 family protein [Candidatus Margulisbacteria bacterium]|nr:TIGR03546 family protein [Candidatus Margulisiibacteriota bacterium]